MLKGLISPDKLFGDLPILKIRFDIRFSENTFLPEYMGSAWRGLIGWELIKLICPFDKGRKCNNCSINESCPYYVLFEKRTDMPGLKNAPRGYIFDCVNPKKDSPLTQLNITLFGSCYELLPALSKAVNKGQKSGIGYKRIPYEVINCEIILPGDKTNTINHEDLQEISQTKPTPLKEWLAKETGDNFKVNITTPLRLRRDGIYLRDFEIQFFLLSLIRRLEALNCIFWEGVPLGKERWNLIKENIPHHDELNSNIRWLDLKRYSNRQRRHVPLGGIIGSISIIDKGLYHWFKVASLVHVGKGASMGLGKLEIINQN